MLTLTRTLTVTKLILKILGISLSGLILFSIFTKNGPNIKDYFFPPSSPPPTVVFGKLPPIFFPRSAVDKSLLLSYSIDTITGLLPVFPDQVGINKIAQIKPRFLALDDARQRVSRVLSRFKETRLSENLYRFTDETFPSREITLNLFARDFTLSSSFLSEDTAALTPANFSDENSAIDASRRFLYNMSSFPDDIDPTRIRTLFYIVRNGRLLPITNISKAQVVRVDFFQKNVNGLPIYYPNASASTINLLVSGPKNRELVIDANFHYQPIAAESATYPIKTASQAFDELKNQKAYIASYYGADTKISINNVFLGYYLGEKRQNYLMPIVIFEGSNGFFAYVSAVKDEWISE